MSSYFLNVDDDEEFKQINIDDLFEKNQKRNLKQLSIFNKILNRINKRITTIGKTKKNDKHTWFIIPEYIFGEPVYDQRECVAYVISKLEENGFFIRYIHPNTLFISWENWIPSYVRNEIKKKHGVLLDPKGNVVKKNEENIEEKMKGVNVVLEEGGKHTIDEKKNQKQYTPINQYKPTGNLVYNPEMFEKLEKKMTTSFSL